MSCYTKEELENKLEDVINELELSQEMIEKHGQLGTTPADLVRAVLDKKDMKVRMLESIIDNGLGVKNLEKRLFVTVNNKRSNDMEKIMKIEKLITEHQEMYKAFLKQNEKLSSGKEQNLLDADGKFFTAEINDSNCKGKIRVEERVFLCQNTAVGRDAWDKLGYKFSWSVGKGTQEDLINDDVANLKLWDYLPKDGEYIYLKTKMGYQCIAIAKEGEYITTYYVSYSLNAHHLYSNENICCSNENIAEIRPATPEQKELIDSELAKQGKRFDVGSKSIKDIEKPKPTFKKGDWFVPHKPKDVNMAMWWACRMDEYEGKILKIEEVSPFGNLASNGFIFHPDWCEKVEAPVKPNKPKVGDLCIFWDKNKSKAIIIKLIEIDKNNFYPFKCSNGVPFENCIPCTSLEQYLEFIKE